MICGSDDVSEDYEGLSINNRERERQREREVWNFFNFQKQETILTEASDISNCIHKKKEDFILLLHVMSTYNVMNTTARQRINSFELKHTSSRKIKQKALKY